LILIFRFAEYRVEVEVKEGGSEESIFASGTSQKSIQNYDFGSGEMYSLLNFPVSLNLPLDPKS
jgi:hypothetical protein